MKVRNWYPMWCPFLFLDGRFVHELLVRRMSFRDHLLVALFPDTPDSLDRRKVGITSDLCVLIHGILPQRYHLKGVLQHILLFKTLNSGQHQFRGRLVTS